MAAPDRAYRYFTNLISKDSTDTKFFIRCAKPLASYVTANASASVQTAEFCSKFKVDGILWVKNPDTPYTASDDPNTVEIVDPSDPTSTITIVDPDLGDPNRDGIISYVFDSTDSTSGYYAFHDIRTSINSGSNVATMYDARSWSRASKFRIKVNADGVIKTGIILNDAGLNRLGEATINTQGSVDLSIDTGVINYIGTYIAPTYNRVLSYGVYYKWQKYDPVNSQTPNINNTAYIYPQNSEHKTVVNSSIPRGTTLTGIVEHPIQIPLLAGDTTYQAGSGTVIINAKDWVFYRPFVITEEGEYSYDYNGSWYGRVGGIKWKTWKVGEITANGLASDIGSELDANSTSVNVFNEARAALIPDVNTDTETYGTMYLDTRLPHNETGLQVLVYNSNSLDTYFSGDIGYYWVGPLLTDPESGLRYYSCSSFVSGTVGTVSGAKYISRMQPYYPKMITGYLNTLYTSASALANHYLIINYYDSDLISVMSDTQDTYHHSIVNHWVSPDGTNNDAVKACIKEVCEYFYSAVNTAGSTNHSEDLDVLAGTDTEWGKADLDNVTSVQYNSIYKNINQVNNIDGVPAATIRTNALYIYGNHLFTGAVTKPYMTTDPNSGTDYISGFKIDVYIRGVLVESEFTCTTNYNGFQFRQTLDR